MPKACIEVAPNSDVIVFDEVRISSCSEDAHWFNWEIDDKINSDDVVQSYGTETVDFAWRDHGTFNITLRVLSEKMKKEDETSTTVTVVDVCYSCSNATTTKDICYSEYDDKATFDSAKNNLEDAGFPCVKQ